jgi:hypothetical protein
MLNINHTINLYFPSIIGFKLNVKKINIRIVPVRYPLSCGEGTVASGYTALRAIFTLTDCSCGTLGDGRGHNRIVEYRYGI